MTAEKLRDMLRRECERAGSQAAWAKKHGIGPAYISDIISGRREPGAKLLRALGVERMVCYCRVGEPESHLRR